MRNLIYVGELATVSREFSCGEKGRIILPDRTSWLATADQNCPLNAKVKVISAVDPFVLRVRLFYS